MQNHFKPPGKHRVKHFYKRPLMDVVGEWGISVPYCEEECEPKEQFQVDRYSG